MARGAVGGEERETSSSSSSHRRGVFSGQGLGAVPPARALGAGLVALDVSGNALRSLRGVEAASGLEELVASRNRLVTLEAVSALGRLRVLDVAENSLARLDFDAAALPRLAVLKCAGNQLVVLDGVAQLPRLDVLDASRNALAALTDVRRCARLRVLDLSGNLVTTLAHAPKCLPASLEALYLARNELGDITDLKYLAGAVALRALSVGGNPLVADARAAGVDHRPFITALLAPLRWLDGEQIRGASYAPTRRALAAEDGGSLPEAVLAALAAGDAPALHAELARRCPLAPGDGPLPVDPPSRAWASVNAAASESLRRRRAISAGVTAASLPVVGGDGGAPEGDVWAVLHATQEQQRVMQERLEADARAAKNSKGRRRPLQGDELAAMEERFVRTESRVGAAMEAVSATGEVVVELRDRLERLEQQATVRSAARGDGAALGDVPIGELTERCDALDARLSEALDAATTSVKGVESWTTALIAGLREKNRELGSNQDKLFSRMEQVEAAVYGTAERRASASRSPPPRSASETSLSQPWQSYTASPLPCVSDVSSPMPGVEDVSPEAAAALMARSESPELATLIAGRYPSPDPGASDLAISVLTQRVEAVEAVAAAATASVQGLQAPQKEVDVAELVERVEAAEAAAEAARTEVRQMRSEREEASSLPVAAPPVPADVAELLKRVEAAEVAAEAARTEMRQMRSEREEASAPPVAASPVSAEDTATVEQLWREHASLVETVIGLRDELNGAQGFNVSELHRENARLSDGLTTLQFEVQALRHRHSRSPEPEPHASGALQQDHAALKAQVEAAVAAARDAEAAISLLQRGMAEEQASQATRTSVFVDELDVLRARVDALADQGPAPTGQAASEGALVAVAGAPEGAEWVRALQDAQSDLGIRVSRVEEAVAETKGNVRGVLSEAVKLRECYETVSQSPAVTGRRSGSLSPRSPEGSLTGLPLTGAAPAADDVLSAEVRALQAELRHLQVFVHAFMGRDPVATRLRQRVLDGGSASRTPGGTGASLPTPYATPETSPLRNPPRFVSPPGL